MRALADVLATELNLHADCICEFEEEVQSELAELVDDFANGLTPDMLNPDTDAALAVAPGDFGATPTHNDDTNAHGFHDCHETDAGGL